MATRRCLDPARYFFSGCTLRCSFCQNRTISRGPAGLTLTPERLADIFRELVDQGALNINLVSPTPYVPAIRQALEFYRPPVPVIYNTGGYERVETLRSLNGLVDIYLPDLKYVTASLAAELSGAPDYFERAASAILEMVRQTGPVITDDRGLAKRGTIVRHLVLPGHTKESLKAIDWLATHLPAGCYVSLMFQYTPMAASDTHPELNRRLTARECNKVSDYLLATGLNDGYIQQRDSAGKGMIPAFDLTGLLYSP